MEDKICLKCGGTGFLISGEPCDCGAHMEMQMPLTLNIPMQYQNVKFDRSFLPAKYQSTFGLWAEAFLKDLNRKVNINKNIVICTAPNTGKTIMAYSAYSILYAKGVIVPEVMDIMEVRHLLLDYYNNDYDKIDLINTAPIAFIKLPLDLPTKWAETMSMIVERRVRNNGATIFLYGGSKDDLLAQDKFKKFESLLGDGSYNTIKVESW